MKSIMTSFYGALVWIAAALPPVYASCEGSNGKTCSWHFYEDPAKAPQPAKPAIASAPTPAPLKNTKLIEAERWKQQVNDAMLISVYDPTPENVLNYVKLKDQLVRHADQVANTHQKIMWANPNMDFSVTGRPISQVGMNTFDAQRKGQRKATIDRLARTHVLFYFARSDCPYCRNFSPTLRAFSDASSIRVMTISVDGQEIPGFPDAQPDNGISQTLNVAMVPAVFLADPASGNITPIGFGAMSEQELLSRIDVITNPEALKESGVTPLRPGAQLVSSQPPSQSQPHSQQPRATLQSSRVQGLRALTGGQP